MKLIVAAAVAVSAVALAAPAFAQDTTSGVTGYANLGVTRADIDDFDVNAGHVRLGARFGRFLGVEGEGAIGLNSPTDSATGVEYKLKHSFGAYGVGFLPLSERADLFARVGVARSKAQAEMAGVRVSDSQTSINYGGGVQFFFTDNDGVRADYTRFDFNNGGGHADTFGLSYVRRF